MIYIDLDNTLFDTDAEFGNKPFTNKEYWQKANTLGFFENLKPLPWAKSLIGFLEDIGVPYRILTATGHNKDSVALEKLRSMEKTFPSVPKANIITLESGKNKFIYAKEGDILIDDTKEVLDNWEIAGGTPLLIDENVIEKLQALLEEKTTC